MDRSRLLFETVVGSHAYGTAHEESDIDLRGVFIEPTVDLLTLGSLPEQFSDERGDEVYYSLRRFLDLALGANPNIIELLFMPEDCVRFVDPAFSQVLESRNLFVTKEAYRSHVGYAQAQIRKARGQNKWINNPQPKETPSPEESCWFIPLSAPEGAMPYRPISLSDSGIDLGECHAAALEHAPNLYRIYNYGKSARGVFRGGKVVCEPIPIEDEHARCMGLLIFNEQAHEKALRDHRNYWTWRANRNDRRWQTQESGQLDYDAKNVMHMFRLMLSAESILTTGRPLVRFSGEKLEFLLSVLHGRFAYDELIQRSEELANHLDELHRESVLPETPDRAKANTLLRSVTQDWEARHA